jgi:hypothetical protein
MKTLLAGLLVVGALLAGSAPSSVEASVGFRPTGVVPHFGGAPTPHAAKAAKIAGTFTCGSIACNAYETGINGYFQDVAAASGAADNVYSVDTQYSDNTGSIAYDETFGGTFVDASAYPTSGCPTSAAGTCLTEDQLVTEINSDLSANGWTASSTNLFFILLPDNVDTCFDDTSTYCASTYFCAYHDSSSSLIFAVEPFNAEWSCDGSSVGQGFPNAAEIDETVNTASHEQNEAITDPTIPSPAWYSSSGDEIGDLCLWSFGANLGTTLGGQPYNQVINGHDYSLQLEYSNAASGCVSHLGGPATGISDGGTGPLTYHGGPVLRTATVYTIYWIPGSTPKISTAPAVTGVAAVGRRLTTTNGTWTNTPTSYVYRWQRCDRTGSNCVRIVNATSSRYTLGAADAGHTIRSEVLASNSGGPAASGYEPSAAATSVVVGKPAVRALPRLAGVERVGKSLSVSRGRWTYSPTRYAYQWLRCSARGISCKKIRGATRSRYRLSRADAGHRVRARVTASNLAGSAKATSARSAAIRK